MWSPGASKKKLLNRFLPGHPSTISWIIIIVNGRMIENLIGLFFLKGLRSAGWSTQLRRSAGSQQVSMVVWSEKYFNELIFSGGRVGKIIAACIMFWGGNSCILHLTTKHVFFKFRGSIVRLSAWLRSWCSQLCVLILNWRTTPHSTVLQIAAIEKNLVRFFLFKSRCWTPAALCTPQSIIGEKDGTDTLPHVHVSWTTSSYKLIWKRT